MTEQEILALIGPVAYAEARRIAAEAPPFRPEQRAALAIILARPAEQPRRDTPAEGSRRREASVPGVSEG